MSTRWQPVLAGEARNRAREAIHAIATDMRRVALSADDREHDPFVALFFAYFAKWSRDPRASKDTARYFRRVVQWLYSSGMVSPALFGGIAGVSWLDAHLDRVVRRSKPDDESHAEIDQVLEQFLSLKPDSFPIELLYGLAGLGVCWLERLPSKRAASALSRLVESAEAAAVATRGGVVWHTPPQWMGPWPKKGPPGWVHRWPEKPPAGFVNLGLAHGMPSLLVTLARIADAGIARKKASRLVEAGVDWMVGIRPRSGPGHGFPRWAIQGRPDTEESPWLRWCYGGLGVSAALLLVGKLMRRRDWVRVAIEMMESAAAIRSMDDAGVVDAGLCHGALGVAHLFNRAFQATRRVALVEAARHWYQVGLDLRKPGEGIGGFLALGTPPGVAFDPQSPPEPQWVPQVRCLTGASGVGLALLAAVSPIEPGWDRLLAISA